MAFDDKAARKALRRADAPQPKDGRTGASRKAQLDEHDLSAEAEGRARSAHRISQPSVMGHRISGARRNSRKTQVASSHVQNANRERMLGRDDSLRVA
jgi:hypothetical protein